MVSFLLLLMFLEKVELKEKMGEKDPDHPYSLKRTSPLRGLGAYADWMAEATDIRGEGFARADGTSVDIGCYQCWLPVVGMKVSIR